MTIKQITCFQCEICGEIHPEEKDAIKCELNGKEISLAETGDVLKYKYNVSGFKYEQDIKIYEICDEGHYLVYKFMIKDCDKWIIEEYYNNELFGNDHFEAKVITK